MQLARYPCSSIVADSKQFVSHGSVAFINNSDSESPKNILMHAPTKIDLHYTDGVKKQFEIYFLKAMLQEVIWTHKWIYKTYQP